jgi:predicted RecB family endonuclease
MEALRKSGNVDVLAVKDGKTIAIEIETGKSNVVRNVKQDLLSGFDKVIVVATDKEALGKVERELARAGLMIPNRVEVILRERSCGAEYM